MVLSSLFALQKFWLRKVCHFLCFGSTLLLISAKVLSGQFSLHFPVVIANNRTGERVALKQYKARAFLLRLRFALKINLQKIKLQSCTFN